MGWNEPETGLDVPEKAVKKEDCHGDDFMEIESMKLMKTPESFACRGKHNCFFCFTYVFIMSVEDLDMLVQKRMDPALDNGAFTIPCKE